MLNFFRATTFSVVRFVVVTTAITLCVSAMVAAKDKVIFDTDTAYFNDDGAALVMLLQRQEQIDLLGVTVVVGNEWPIQGVEYMLHIAETLGADDLPFFIGARSPLLLTRERALYMDKEWGGINWLGAYRSPRPTNRSELRPPYGGQFAKARPKRENAVQFIIDTVNAHPNEVTILALGPMTNIAMALRLAPEIETKIKRLVFMGGNVHVPGNVNAYAEFNFWCDPEAAHAAFSSDIPEKVMFGLDITNQAVFSKEHYDELIRAQTPIARLVEQDFGHRHPGFEKNPEAKAHIWDCLAAGFLLDEKIVTNEETLNLTVVTQFGPEYGAVRKTQPHGVDGKPVRVMLKLDFERFYAMYKESLTRPVKSR